MLLLLGTDDRSWVAAGANFMKPFLSLSLGEENECSSDKERRKSAYVPVALLVLEKRGSFKNAACYVRGKTAEVAKENVSALSRARSYRKSHPSELRASKVYRYCARAKIRGNRDCLRQPLQPQTIIVRVDMTLFWSGAERWTEREGVTKRESSVCQTNKKAGRYIIAMVQCPTGAATYSSFTRVPFFFFFFLFRRHHRCSTLYVHSNEATSFGKVANTN